LKIRIREVVLLMMMMMMMRHPRDLQLTEKMLMIVSRQTWRRVVDYTELTEAHTASVQMVVAVTSRVGGWEMAYVVIVIVFFTITKHSLELIKELLKATRANLVAKKLLVRRTLVVVVDSQW